MRILVYNIAYGTGSPGGIHKQLFTAHRYLKADAEHFEKISGFIEQSNADIVGLVEADAGSYRTGYHDQIAELAARLKHYHIDSVKYGENSFSRNIPILNKQSNALLTRDRSIEAKLHFFSRGMKKLVIEAEINGVKVFVIHLALRKSVRAKQLAVLAEMIPPRAPVIVAGDFNAVADSEEMQDFMQTTGLINPNRKNLPTYPAWRPKRQLDYLLHSPEIVPEHFEIPQVVYSDHLPLIMDFKKLTL
ncbi:MAG: endonuclease/exonuclease/phosphatase family protein [Victivallaceae bacterium]